MKKNKIYDSPYPPSWQEVVNASKINYMTNKCRVIILNQPDKEYFFDEISINNDGVQFSGDISKTWLTKDLDDSEYVVSWYTGVEDNRENEIYEHDIITASDTSTVKTGVVKFGKYVNYRENAFDNVYSHGFYISGLHNPSLYRNWGGLKKLGNIFKDKNLIKKHKLEI